MEQRWGGGWFAFVVLQADDCPVAAAGAACPPAEGADLLSLMDCGSEVSEGHGRGCPSA